MIDIEMESGIAVIRMNHGKVNAIDLKFCESFLKALGRVAHDETASAAVLVGNDRVFSAGVDLVWFLESEPGFEVEFISALSVCFKEMFEFPKPLVAAINGPAVAGGCVLAAACDFRVTHDMAKIGVPELRVGVPFPSIAIEIMRFAAAPIAFQTMINIGKTYRGDDALRVGLADQIVDKEQVIEAALRSAHDLATIPPKVFEVSKRQMRAPAIRRVEENEAELEGTILSIWQCHENRKVIQRFVAQRLNKGPQ